MEDQAIQQQLLINFIMKFQNDMKLNYSLIARTFPVLITLLPVIILGGYFSINLSLSYVLMSSIGFYAALSFLLNQIGRDFGKKKEPALWKEWGGMPTIQILRHSNNHLDSLTKKRYHAQLNQFCPVEEFPSLEFEQSFPEKANEVYSTWTKFMISNTRDTTKYSLLYKENVNYGFRRNLWGLKPIAISLILVSILIVVGFNHFECGIKNFIEWPIDAKTVLGVLFFMLLVWLMIVNKDWIKRVGFSYAERLFELTEKIQIS